MTIAMDGNKDFVFVACHPLKSVHALRSRCHITYFMVQLCARILTNLSGIARPSWLLGRFSVSVIRKNLFLKVE
jgi:hypothetical protein